MELLLLVVMVQGLLVVLVETAQLIHILDHQLLTQAVVAVELIRLQAARVVQADDEVTLISTGLMSPDLVRCLVSNSCAPAAMTKEAC